MNFLVLKRIKLGTLLAPWLATVAVQIPLFGLLDVYPLIFDFAHLNLRKMYSLESLLIFNLIELLFSVAFWGFVIGLPLFGLLRFLRFERMWTSALAGFVIASANHAYTRWPNYDFLNGFSYEYSYWLGGEILYTQDGALTAYAWADYIIELTRLGLHGLVAGVVFYWVWRNKSASAVVPVSS